MSARRTEPTAHLVAKRGQATLLDYVPACRSNIAERFARMREEQRRAAPIVTVLQPSQAPALPVAGVVPLRLRSVRA